jgi:hypothetical protein
MRNKRKDKPEGHFNYASIISLRSNITRRKANKTVAHFLTECATRLALFCISKIKIYPSKNLIFFIIFVYLYFN